MKKRKAKIVSEAPAKPPDGVVRVVRSLDVLCCHVCGVDYRSAGFTGHQPR